MARGKRRQVLHISDLPWEILVTIFLRLPIKSVGRAKCTCKLWYTIITDHKFVETHFNRAVENPGYVYRFDDSYRDLYFLERIPGGTEATRISSGLLLADDLKTSGGLMAFFNEDEDCFSICNPITREQIKLPMAPYFDEDFVIIWWGFGYSSTTKEHKILLFGSTTPETFLSLKGAIYTLGSESWRDIPHVPFCPLYSRECVDCGGTLFWLISQDDSNNCLDTIGSFEIGSEKFRGWRGPFSEMDNELKLRGSARTLFLLNLGDTLFCCVRRDIVHFIIWVLRNKVSESWIKENEIRSLGSIFFGLISPIGFWMDSDLPFFSGDMSKYYHWSIKSRAAGKSRGRWLIYDTIREEYRDLEVPFNAYSDGSPREPAGIMLSHVGSLISPRQIAALDA